MKTSLILNDTLVRKAKSRAALQGLTLSRYMEACLEKSLHAPEPECVGDWIRTLPNTPKSAAKEVNSVIAQGAFDEIDKEMWQ